MNREIKFRAWDKTINHMTFNFWCMQDDIRGLYVMEDKLSELPYEPEVQPTLMQFTGLTDKKGKEIYEGDILKTFNEEYPHVVEWMEEVGVGGGGVGFDLEREMSSQWEIIGNIYENPELIKK